MNTTARTLLVKKHILVNYNKDVSFTSDDIMKLMETQRSNVTPSLTQLRRDGIIAICGKRGHTFIYKMEKFVPKDQQLNGFPHRTVANPHTRKSTANGNNGPTIGIKISALIPQSKLGRIIQTIKDLDPNSSIEL